VFHDIVNVAVTFPALLVVASPSMMFVFVSSSVKDRLTSVFGSAVTFIVKNMKNETFA
jgi:hypothetical protein